AQCPVHHILAHSLQSPHPPRPTPFPYTTLFRSVLVIGHTKRPRSIRLENRHRPWPSYHSSLTRSPRLPRKANRAPECGLCSSTCCASTARPSNPLRISVAPQAR